MLRSDFAARSLARAGTMALWLVVGLSICPGSARAQADSVFVSRATLRAWEEWARLAIFDRGGSYYGRTSDRGILQRFNEKMDAEYDLDVISSRFSLTEDYAWYRRDSGARFWAGSIDHLRLVQQGDFKAAIALGGTWSVNARFMHDESLRARRNLLWLGFSKSWDERRSRIFLQGTLKAVKPEADLEFGFVWSRGGTQLTVAVAALDAFSNFNYQTLGVDPSVADTALDYTAHPFTARVALDIPLGQRARLEGYALLLTPTTVVVESQTRPGDGFTQDERYAYAGGLLEWAPATRTALGGFATWVRARLDRTPLPAARAEDHFDLTEITASAGIYAIHDFRGRLAFEGWVARVWRTEDRLVPDTSATPDIDYEDRTWAGRNSLTYRAPGGFRAVLGLDFTARQASGPAPVTTREPLDRDNVRLRFDLGWAFARKALFALGANLDLDAGRFDGAHGRFAFHW